MRRGRARLLAAFLCCAAAALPGAAAAQSVPAQSRLYLLASDAADARALWVNPAGLARRIEAAIGGHVTAEDTARDLRVAQFGALLATRAFAAGWQRDDLAGGRRFDTWAVAVGLGDEKFALGGTRKWYRGSTANDGGWDLGVHVTPRPGVSFSTVWRDIGSPRARDSVLEETLVPGAALDVLGGRGRAAVEWHLATTGFVTRSVRVGTTAAAGRGISFTAITDLSGNVRLRGITLAVHVSRPTARFSLVRRTSALRGTAGQVGAAGLIVAPPPSRRRFR